jgi:hypothetical protein
LGYMLVYPCIYENICKKACTLELSKKFQQNQKKKKKNIFLAKYLTFWEKFDFFKCLPSRLNQSNINAHFLQ